jgi:hypothetical protein
MLQSSKKACIKMKKATLGQSLQLDVFINMSHQRIIPVFTI